MLKARAAVFGSFGSAFAALCCAGAPAILAALSAAGLGFLINDVILFPLLAISLASALWGLTDGAKRHGLRAIVALGGLGAALVVVGILTSPALVWAGAGGLIGASAWNALALRRSRRGGANA